MPKKILVLLGHPRVASFCGALADRYEKGATESGATIRRIDIADLNFSAFRDVIHVAPAEDEQGASGRATLEGDSSDPEADVSVPQQAPGLEAGGLEPAVAESMETIRWADRIVWVYPLWWGFMPALLKGFIDQVLAQPDFASTYNKYGMPVGLLKPRRSTLIVTMDAPVYWERLFKRDRGIGVLVHSILKLCGIKVDRTIRIGDMFESTTEHREKALARVEEAGRRDAGR